jgi:hypothetical protein
MKAFGKLKVGVKGYSLNKILSNNNTPLYKFPCKYVSGNPQSKVNRENRELDKIEKFWEGVDAELAVKNKIVKEVEAKYNIESFFVGKNVTNPNQLDSTFEEKLVDVYYVPLTKEDGNLLNNFSSATAESIIKGGRVVLHNEVVNFNRSQPIDQHLKLTPAFEPLTNEELSELQYDFAELYQSEKLFNYVLQNGKDMFTELKKIREGKIKQVTEYKNKLNYVEHYGEAMSSIPFNSKISVDFQRYEDPHYVKFLMKEKKVDEEKLTENLKEIYLNYYKELNETIKARNENKVAEQKSETVGLDKIKSQIEPCLFDRTLAFVDYLKLNNLKFEIEKGTLPEDKEQCYIFEKLLFKGVQLNRYQNDEPNDYILIDSHEDLGIRYYMHKYLIGENTKFNTQKDALTTSFDNNSQDFHNSKDFFVKERNRKIVLRVYLFVKHPQKVKVMNNNSNLIEYAPSYTYNHLAVFENELIAPNQSFLINNNFESWMSKQKLDDKNWKLVDVDNFMKGNPFFLKKSSFAENIDKVFSDDVFTVKSLEAKFPDIKNPENLTFKFAAAEKKPKKADKGEKTEKKGKGEAKAQKPKEAKEAKDEKIEDKQSLISSLQFDYKVTKIPRPYDDIHPEIRALTEQADTEYYKMIDAELKKNAEALEAQSRRQAEIKRSLDVMRLFNLLF